MKVSVDNSNEKFGSKTSIADLAQYFVKDEYKLEGLRTVYEKFKFEYRHELLRSQYVTSIGIANFFFKDGSSLCISEDWA